MKYANSIIKGFLDYAQPGSPATGNKILTYQDPTYLGFQWRIIDTTDYSKRAGSDVGYDLDYYPQGLFLSKDDPDSAQNYFIRTNQTARAEMIAEFRESFIYLLKNAPWYFTKVTGLADIWKIEPGQSFRGKDKKLTIETEEALDLKMTYLMDLYRKAIFDPSWMRYALPENQRMFAMELIVGEIRPMQITPQGFNSLESGPYPGNVLDNIGGQFKSIQSQIDQQAAQTPLTNVFANDPDFPQIALFTSVVNGLNALRSQSTPAGEAYPTIKAPWSPGTFLSFRFDFCTFDIFDQSPNYLESVGKTPDTMAKNTIVINTPYISEVNRYGLLGAILKDSYYQADYAYDIKNIDDVQAGILSAIGDGNFSRSYVQNTTQARSGLSRAIGNLVDDLGTGVVANISNIVTTAVNRGLLGNVYGISPARLLGSTLGFLANPAAAASSALTNFLGPSTSQQNQFVGNVQLTGPEIELVQNIIGTAVEDGVLANPGLVSGRAGRTVEDSILANENLVSTTKTNVNLTGPDIVKAQLLNVYRR